MMGGKILKKIEIGFVEERITNANDFFLAMVPTWAHVKFIVPTNVGVIFIAKNVQMLNKDKTENVPAEKSA